MSIQHYVRGDADDNFAKLSNMYGVSASDIAYASGYSWDEDAIYDWLSANRGTKQSRYPSTPSGYIWSFTPGMVLNIPGVDASRSPVVAGAVPAPFPGGPEVVIVASPDGGTVVQPTNGDQDTVVPGGGGGASQAAVGGGLTNIIIAGVAIGAVMYLFGGGKKKGKGRAKGKSRKTTRARRAPRRRSRR